MVILATHIPVELCYKTRLSEEEFSHMKLISLKQRNWSSYGIALKLKFLFSAHIEIEVPEEYF